MGKAGEGHEGQATRRAVKAKELASTQGWGDTGSSLWPKRVLFEKEAGEPRMPVKFGPGWSQRE